MRGDAPKIQISATSDAGTVPLFLHRRRKKQSNHFRKKEYYTKMTIRLRAYYANFINDSLIAYVALRMAKFMRCDTVGTDLLGFSSDSSVDGFRRSPAIYRDAIPRGLPWAAARRCLGDGLIAAVAEARYLASLDEGDIAYVWPNSSSGLYRKLKARGHIVVTERINTLLHNSKRILDEEFARLGMPPSHGLSEAAVAEELETMRLSDYIFSPSPGVTDSLLEAGISDSKIIRSSYGLRDTELLGPRPVREKGAKVTAIFAGSICVRKGVHLMLEAWERAGIAERARLVVVGRIAPEIQPLLSDYSAKGLSIEHVDFVADLKPLFAEADFFVLPSLEEGSPLVTYLALGAGLPCVVSPMGAGGVVRDGEDGIVVDPHDVAAMSAAYEAMAGDAGLRARQGAAAWAKAADYTWDKVAARRRDELLSRLGRPRA